MRILNLVKFCQFDLKILISGNEILMSIKGHNSVTNLGKMMCNNAKPDLVNINAYTKFGKILSFVLKILISGNKILNKTLTFIKGHNSITNVRKMICNNGNPDLDNIIAYTKFGEILKFCFKILSGNEIMMDGQNGGQPKSSTAPFFKAGL